MIIQKFRGAIINPRSLFAVFIFIIGVALRMYAAINYPLWLDEASYFFTSDSSVKDILFLNHWNVSQPPLYTLILHFWKMLGTSEIMLRIPSLFFSTVTFFIAYQLSKKLVDQFFGIIVLGIVLGSKGEQQPAADPFGGLGMGGFGGEGGFGGGGY